MAQQMSLGSDLRDIDEIIQKLTHLFQSNQSRPSLENLMLPVHDVNMLFGVNYNFIQILARGPSLSTAYQAALNFKEIVKIVRLFI